MTQPNAVRNPDNNADVIVVGAGPAGSTAATYLARSGVDVLLLEKSTFPRDKVCGDGLTPRGVKQVLALGIDVSGPDWLKNKGLRVIGGGRSLELPWPVLQDFPDFGLVRPRRDFDDILATLAVKAGARMRVATSVTAPVRDDRTGRITGVIAKTQEGQAEFTAPLVLACDGVSARVALGMGINKRDDRPLGVAVRRYYRSPSRADDDYLESHLELWDRTDPSKPKLLPGYGWIFGLGDGTVNVGLGMLNSSKAFGKTDYRALLRTWLDGTPQEWGLREENAIGPIGGAGLRRRSAAGRRRRRRGQPVQRRGHRVRDGVGRDGRRVGTASARPPRGRQPGGRPGGVLDRDEGAPRLVLPARRDLLHADR